MISAWEKNYYDSFVFLKNVGKKIIPKVFCSGQFGKYVKVEIFSHYGNEHYCPVSLFKIFGIDQLELIADIGKTHMPLKI